MSDAEEIRKLLNEIFGLEKLFKNDQPEIDEPEDDTVHTFGTMKLRTVQSEATRMLTNYLNKNNIKYTVESERLNNRYGRPFAKNNVFSVKLNKSYMDFRKELEQYTLDHGFELRGDLVALPARNAFKFNYRT